LVTALLIFSLRSAHLDFFDGGVIRTILGLAIRHTIYFDWWFFMLACISPIVWTVTTPLDIKM